jgi:N-methylhydantoinase B
VLAGAGGWGDPLERDPAAVLKDVRNELLSLEKAESDYGVVIVKEKLDLAATAKRRAEIRAARGWREVPKVQREDPLPQTAKPGTDHVFRPHSEKAAVRQRRTDV